MTKNTWQLFDLVLRNTLLSVWRWPLLTAATILAATLVWGLYLEDVRFATAAPSIANIAVFYAIHAIVFAPLIVAVIRTTLGQKVGYADLGGRDIWLAMSISVFLLLVFRLAWDFFLKSPIASAVFDRVMDINNPFILNFAAYVLPSGLFDCMILAIVLCFILLLPRIALGQGASPIGALRMLKGHFGMALKLGVLTVLPFYLGRLFLPSVLFHPVHGPLTHSWQGIYPWEFNFLDWAEMLQQNVFWAGWMILSAVLSATVYQVATNRLTVTAP